MKKYVLVFDGIGIDPYYIRVQDIGNIWPDGNVEVSISQLKDGILLNNFVFSPEISLIFSDPVVVKPFVRHDFLK